MAVIAADGGKVREIVYNSTTAQIKAAILSTILTETVIIRCIEVVGDIVVIVSLRVVVLLIYEVAWI